MEKEDTDVSFSASGWLALLMRWIADPVSCAISDIGSGNYEPAEGHSLPPPVTNYGATGR